MAEVTFTINIDTESFNKILEENLYALPQEEIQKIILNCIQKILEEDAKEGNGILLSKESSYYGGKYAPTSYFSSILNKVNVDEICKPVTEKLTVILNEHYEEIMMKALTSAIASLLFGKEKQIEFYNNIQASMYEWVSNNFRGKNE